METFEEHFEEQTAAMRRRLAVVDGRMRERLAEPEHLEFQRVIAARIDVTAAEERLAEMALMGIPAGLRKHADQPIETEAIAAVRRFLKGQWQEGEEPKPNVARPLVLLLAGDKGRGKTVAACWAIALQHGRYAQASDLVAGGWFSGDAFDELRFASVLALDELGMEPLDEKGWSGGLLHRLIDRRIADGKRTILVTNLRGPDFKARYGTGDYERTWDRLTGSWSVAAFTGPSMRQTGVES